MGPIGRRFFNLSPARSIFSSLPKLNTSLPNTQTVSPSPKQERLISDQDIIKGIHYHLETKYPLEIELIKAQLNIDSINICSKYIH